MAIRARLLNKTVNVIRITETSVSGGIGEKTKTIVTDITGLKVRINRNKRYGSNNPENEYFLSNSTHLIFADYRTDINTVHYIKDGSDYYKVDYVDKNPGGTTNHIQIYCTLHENMKVT